MELVFIRTKGRDLREKKEKTTMNQQQLQHGADLANLEQIEHEGGALLDRYCVVRDGEVKAVPRAELTLEEREHIVALSREAGEECLRRAKALEQGFGLAIN